MEIHDKHWMSELKCAAMCGGRSMAVGASPSCAHWIELLGESVRGESISSASGFSVVTYGPAEPPASTHRKSDGFNLNCSMCETANARAAASSFSSASSISREMMGTTCPA
eukprot:scaffold237769_cov30-Tisochrysis_lutea.AAC.2